MQADKSCATVQLVRARGRSALRWELLGPNAAHGIDHDRHLVATGAVVLEFLSSAQFRSDWFGSGAAHRDSGLLRVDSRPV
ncbi:MAG: hypothetical protein QM708_06145 [Propioniciclava sp.]|uniref:hypothetical protein n=1 Tax=Propioniciclava sp. TaxID=2038686 RepID=UPI0039E5F0D5